jgi:hypothetical protein
VARLEQVKGVETLIALTYVLTLEDPAAQRVPYSRIGRTLSSVPTTTRLRLLHMPIVKLDGGAVGGVGDAGFC